VCSACGYRFLEDRRPGRALLVAVGIGALLAGAVLVVAGRDEEPATDSPHAHTELLANHPLSRREAERHLGRRFTSRGDPSSAAARCSAREPRPAHALRHCRVRYPNGTHRGVVVLLDARGRELLSEP
jgi:hypothetical protein